MTQRNEPTRASRIPAGVFDLGRDEVEAANESDLEAFAYLAAFQKRSCDGSHQQFLEWWIPDRKYSLHQIDSILAAAAAGNLASR